MFVLNLWFCRLHVISFLTLSSIAIEGVIGKVEQNELDCRGTAPLMNYNLGNKCNQAEDPLNYDNNK